MNEKLKRILITTLVLVSFLFTAIGSFGFTTANAGGVTEDDVNIYFAGNRNYVLDIDEVDGGVPVNFKAMRDSADLTVEQKMQVMENAVNVAKAYKDLESTASDVLKAGAKVFDGYADLGLYTNYQALEECMLNAKADIKITSSNYLTYDNDGSFLLNLVGLKLKFAELKEAIYLANEYVSLAAANFANPTGSATTVKGFYDNTAGLTDYGMEPLTAIYNQGKDLILNPDYFSSTYVPASQIRTECIEKLRKLPKNALEYVYMYYADATAVDRNVCTEEEIDASNNPLLTSMGLCQYEVEKFWNNANDEVKGVYATQYDYLSKYFAENQEYDGTATSTNTSTLTYKVNGKVIMTITAYVKSSYQSNARTANQEATVFAPNCAIRLYSDTLGSEERNVGKLLNDKKDGINAGYFVKFNVYGGKAMSTVFDAERANAKTPGGVIYVVNFNLANYFSEIVSKNQGLVGSMLGDTFSSGIWGAKDKTEQIAKAYEMVNGSDVDLCYFYENGQLKPFENITLNGGILMLETTAFGNFAVAAADNGPSMFAEPLFWLLLIVGIIVLWIVLAIVLKYVKYSVKFYSNGGTVVKKVRARKGEYFAMPKSPTKEGFVFAGWFEDKELTRRFLAVRIVKRKGLKAYAKWALELTPERVDRYYKTLRQELASRACLAPDFAIEQGQTKNFAVLEKLEKTLNLYLAFDPATLKKEGYEVQDASATSAETPSLFVIATREDYIVAQKLVDKLIETFSLCESEVAPMAEGEAQYVLAISAVVPEEPVEEVVEEEPVEEVVEEEPAEEVVEETTEEVVEEEPVEEVVEETTEEVVEEEPVEEVVEETTEEVVEEEPVEEEPVEEPAPVATEEQLIEYFTKIRTTVCSYALYDANEKAENGKMLVKLYKKEEAVYCYMALDAESYGLETVGLGFSDTPALIKVANDEDLAKALSLVEVMMLDHGFEKLDEEVEVKPYDGKGFGYRIHYVEE